MAVNSKKLSIYVFAGIFMAAIVIAAVYTSGMHLPSMNPSDTNQPNPSANPTTSPTISPTTNPTSLTHNTGTLVLYLKDAPVDIVRLDVEFDSVEVLGPDGWTSLAFVEGTETVSFNLLELQNVVADLSIAELPVGAYNKIRLHVLQASANFANDPEVPVTLKVPSEKIDIIVKFEVQEAATTQVIIDMTADSVAISNSHNLKPVVKATVIPAENTPTQTPSPTPTPPAETPISTEESSPTPTPTPTSTEEPSATPTPTPTSTEEPTPTPTPTQEPTPTVTPTEESSPTPTPTTTPPA